MTERVLIQAQPEDMRFTLTPEGVAIEFDVDVDDFASESCPITVAGGIGWSMILQFVNALNQRLMQGVASEEEQQLIVPARVMPNGKGH